MFPKNIHWVGPKARPKSENKMQYSLIANNNGQLVTANLTNE
jgi:hypothetical protein